MNPTRSGSQKSERGRRGATLVLMVLLMPVFIGMVAFAVEVGRMAVLRGEIQNAVDAGALAASLRMRQDAGNIDQAADAARDYVKRNRVGSAVTIPTNAIQVEIGQWDSTTRTFTATNNSPNSVRVFAQQIDPFLFGRFFGQDSFGGTREAIASGASNPLDIMMVLDLSGSMASQGRIQALWNASPTFVDVIEGLSDGDDDQIGVMGLATDPSGYDPAALGNSGVVYSSGLHPTNDHYAGVLEGTLTTNFTNLRNSILAPSNLPAGKYTGWTGTGAAIGDATHYLVNGSEARSEAKKIIVLLSDGYANRPTGNGSGYALEMTAYALSNKVTIYTISLGNDADLALMQSIASSAGGEHFDATGSGESLLTEKLKTAFKKVAATIKRSQLVQ